MGRSGTPARRDGDVRAVHARPTRRIATALTEVLAEHDEAILRAYVGDEATLPYRAAARAARRADAARRRPPGVLRLGRARASGSTSCSPASTSSSSGVAAATRTAPVSGRVFKIERTAVGRARRLRPPVRRHAPAAAARARRRGGGGEGDLDQGLRPGRRAAPRRPRRRRDGDDPRPGRRPGRRRDRRAAAGRRRRPRASRARRSRPSCSRSTPEQQGSLRAALAQLAEQDPLIDVRQDDHRHEIAVSLYGEVQKEVIQATLERDYGIAADFRETTTVCIERPARVGEAEEVIRAKTKTNITGRSSPLSTNPFKATLALRIEPAASGSGIEFRARRRAAARAAVPVQDAGGVPRPRWRRTSARRWREGLAGWQVTDCRVTMTDCGYASPETSAADFRRLTQLVLTTALDRAGTWVCEPLADLALEMPGVDGAGRARGARPARRPRDRPVLRERRDAGSAPCCRSPASASLQHQLPGLSMGEGILETAPRRLPADRRATRHAAPRSTPEPARPRRLARVAGEAGMTFSG